MGNGVDSLQFDESSDEDFFDWLFAEYFMLEDSTDGDETGEDEGSSDAEPVAMLEAPGEEEAELEAVADEEPATAEQAEDEQETASLEQADEESADAETAAGEEAAEVTEADAGPEAAGAETTGEPGPAAESLEGGDAEAANEDESALQAWRGWRLGRRGSSSTARAWRVAQRRQSNPFDRRIDARCKATGAGQCERASACRG